MKVAITEGELLKFKESYLSSGSVLGDFWLCLWGDRFSQRIWKI